MVLDEDGLAALLGLRRCWGWMKFNVYSVLVYGGVGADKSGLQSNRQHRPANWQTGRTGRTTFISSSKRHRLPKYLWETLVGGVKRRKSRNSPAVLPIVQFGVWTAVRAGRTASVYYSPYN